MLIISRKAFNKQCVGQWLTALMENRVVEKKSVIPHINQIGRLKKRDYM